MRKSKDSLGDRMKMYEDIYRTFLPRKQYYIIRIDGKAFHSYTKGLDRPFDEQLMEDMQQTMLFLCEGIQGAVFGYTQSDEITIVMTDLQSQESQIWFNGNIQKIVSVAASMATSKFNKLRGSSTNKWFAENHRTLSKKDFKKELNKRAKLAQFDARVFSISQRHEVLNNILWRQQDASKNSIQMLARSLFSHKELQGLKSNQLKSKLKEERGIHWDKLDTPKKVGSACYKTPDKDNPVRNKWIVDKNIPNFSQDWGWFDDKINMEV